MAFGLLISLETGGAIATGWVKRTLIDPPVTFPFFGLDFLQPLPGHCVYFVFLSACNLAQRVFSAATSPAPSLLVRPSPDGPDERASPEASLRSMDMDKNATGIVG
jgi:hypothetical protein